MYSLANDSLDVSVLDPAQDQVRLGARYVVGGYVYQITDRKLGALLSGPAYPEEYPPVGQGQGMPEAFAVPVGADPATAPAGATMLGIGIGLLQKSAEALRRLVVQEFCRWQVRQAPGLLVMETCQDYQDWALELSRELALDNRTLRSQTHVRNVGGRDLPLRWYPHPFYPWYPSGECCKFSFPVRVADNPGFTLRDNGFIQMKLDHVWDRRGHDQDVDFDHAEKLCVLQKHPKLGLVAATCSFTPAYLPIWGNCNTFSFEPYFDQTVPPGGEARWAITYDF